MAQGTDPFDEVKAEILSALDGSDGKPGVRSLYARWKLLSDDPAPRQEVLDELVTLQKALQDGLRQVEWDVKDLQETIEIVMNQPHRFQINETVLERRYEFVDMIASELSNMQRGMEKGRSRGSTQPVFEIAAGATPTGKSKRGGYSALDDAEAQQLEQDLRQEMELHDERFGGQIAHGIGELRDMAKGMGDELRDQDRELSRLERGIDSARASLTRNMNRLDHIAASMGTKKQVCCVIVLMIVLVVLIVLTFGS
eukprot:TRINITY_DN24009_c0_g1_i1.p1 TRINITY_DN24009_c0_g1~~TRINITY_DN24009_c0_g1_i1.p1  ORF type:complete len:255 (+),score=84.26 TRINITY_DN24009_c0_g1_i1:84-848(+)